MPKVSIVVPGYNAEKYIKECLESIVVQTLDDIEVLLIDDGSTDATGRIFDEYAEKYPFVRVIHQENCGIFLTRAKAINTAKGDYIGWVDADDYIEPSMYGELYNLAIENQSDLVYCNYDYFPHTPEAKDKWFRPYKGKRDVNYVERNSQFWNKIVKRGLLLKLRIDEMLPTCFEESMILALLKAENPISLDKTLYHYRVGHGSMSSRYKNVLYYKRFIEASKNLKTAMEVVFDKKYWKEYFSFRIVYYYLMTAIVAANAGDKKGFVESIKQMRKEYPNYYRNQHYWSVLRDIYGGLKAFVIGYLVPINYYTTRLMCKFVFG